MDKRQGCAGCGYNKIYNYGKKIYYCDHEGMTDDMGRLGMDHLPETGPEWCPLGNNETAVLWQEITRQNSEP